MTVEMANEDSNSFENERFVCNFVENFQYLRSHVWSQSDYSILGLFVEFENLLSQANLTGHQRNVLELVIKGYSQIEIADMKRIQRQSINQVYHKSTKAIAQQAVINRKNQQHRRETHAWQIK